jgi:hypothetical protein
MAKVEIQKVNYIQHLLAVSGRFMKDDRLSALHISLYYSLFHTWNLSKFRNPISICREEVMQASKIGSANTYTKCLKDLDNWQYLKYIPSFDSYKGSKIYLYTFNKTIDNGINNTNDKSTSQTTVEGAGKASIKAVIPSINSINNINNTNIVNGKKINSHEKKTTTSKKIKNGKAKTEQKNRDAEAEKKSKNAGAKKFRAAPEILQSGGESFNKVESSTDSPIFKRPSAKFVSAYFLKKQWPEVESQKFFNHYESNGWLIGGKSPMQNWQAAAANWILNQANFGGGKISNGQSEKTQRSNHLNVNQTKDYNEPL